MLYSAQEAITGVAPENRYQRRKTMDIVKTISEKILGRRRERGITQDALAAALGVTYQAVSKWENALACPDVTMLPKIAEYFGISMAELFGEEKPCAKATDEPQANFEADKDWQDDNTLHAVLFRGRKMIKSKNITEAERTAAEKVVLTYEGDVGNILSDIAVDVKGNVGGYISGIKTIITVTGDVDSNIISTSGTVNITGNVDGNVVGTGATVTVDGDIGGNVSGTGIRVNVSGKVNGKSADDYLKAGADAAKAAFSDISDASKIVDDALKNIGNIEIPKINFNADCNYGSDDDDNDYADLADTASDLHDLLSEMEDLQDELEDLKDELEDLNDELEDLNDEAEDLRDELSDLADELSDADSDDERKRIIADMSDKKSEISDKNSEIEDKKSEISDKKEEIAEKRAEIAEKKSEIAEKKEALR